MAPPPGVLASPWLRGPILRLKLRRRIGNIHYATYSMVNKCEKSYTSVAHGIRTSSHSGLEEAADTALLRLLSGGEAAEGSSMLRGRRLQVLAPRMAACRDLELPSAFAGEMAEIDVSFKYERTGIAVESGLGILSPTTEFPYAGGVLEGRERLSSNSSPHDFKLSFDWSKAG
ncbi:hypothetical protein K438DRAFT_1987787 [Mycena galopus ATCC 62051]|nr:hypothetical protein K438DRAFT_1987787 [Mycena galopus ATCC 62051]